MSRRWGRTLGWSSVIVTAMASHLAALGQPGQQEPIDMEPRVRLDDPFARTAVTLAVRRAAERLDKPECQRIFTEFSDTSGRPLLEALQSATPRASQYLVEHLWFIDGSENRPCVEDERTLAFTVTNHKVVRLCSTRFVARALHDSRTAEVILIHELLHTLGLGENPPSSSEITQKVKQHCG